MALQLMSREVIEEEEEEEEEAEEEEEDEEEKDEEKDVLTSPAIALHKNRHPSPVTLFLASTNVSKEMHSTKDFASHLIPMSPKLQHDKFKYVKVSSEGNTSDNSAPPSGPSSLLDDKSSEVSDKEIMLKKFPSVIHLMV